ncbi:MAG: CHAT domain-containing protein [Bacteroidetes bacterium]|nr:MAG: CHAT domain-containing protein [Bacteroidota bacterium]
MLVKEITLDDFILLDASLTAKQALKKLENSYANFVIIERKEGNEIFHYLFSTNQLIDRLEYVKGDVILTIALDLHESGSNETITSEESVDMLYPDEPYVVLIDAKPVGYVIPPEEAMEESSPPENGDEHDEFWVPPVSPKLPGSSKGAEADDDESFEAYPSISDPGKLEGGQEFKVYVGFSSELDKTLLDVKKVSIDKPTSEPVMVSLMAIGATISNSEMKPLALHADAQTVFEGTVNSGASEINLIATYFYQFQPVGTARRNIKIGVVQDTAAKPDPEEEGCSMNLEGVFNQEGKVDITVTIKKDEADKQLHWHITSPDPESDESAKVSYDDAKSFAKVLGVELKKEDYKSRIARNALITLGQSIADLIPEAFFNIYKAVSEKTGSAPRILIWTDEPYIPWELAYSNNFSIDTDAPDFLGTQAIIGRWWLHQRVVTPPPTGLTVGRLTAIAADYPFTSPVKPLEEAIKEKEFLRDKFNATIVEAKKDDILDMTEITPPIKGHALHMALHGYSDPTHNEQKIIVEDGDLSPNSMIGVYNCGDVPPISFMFLNACQVGTAGASLGQASGFPGVLLKKGMLGFVAPLWEVHDTHARVFAEQFYEEVLNKKRPVAEVLLELRKNYDYKESLTPLAYLFYGNPGLTLEYKK